MPRNERLGILSLLAAAFLFALTTALVKLSSASLSGYLISAMRFLVGIVLSAAAILTRSGKIRVTNRKDWVLRGLYGAVSMILSYLAIARTSGGRATLLGNTYPIFVALFAALFFRERLSRAAVPSLALCTLGSALVLNDGAGYPTTGDVLAILSAVFAGLALNHLKRARATEDPFTLYLSPCLFGLPVSAVLSARGVAFAPGALALAAGIGVVVFLAQICMTWGYKHVPVSRGSRIFYLETLLAIGFGALLGERLRPAFFAGGALIAAGLAFDAWDAARRKSGKILAVQ
ncbi:MAG TPA: DMT family transporter [Spirochaetia bacterium]|nr:DMT family transporter [Spirochaetia bacterium]